MALEEGGEGLQSFYPSVLLGHARDYGVGVWVTFKQWSDAKWTLSRVLGDNSVGFATQ